MGLFHIWLNDHLMGMLWRKFRCQRVGGQLDMLTIPFQLESMWFHELHCPWFPVFWHFLSAAGRQAGLAPPPAARLSAPPRRYSREAVTQTGRKAACPEASWRIINSLEKRSSTHPSYAWQGYSSPNPHPSWHLLSMTLGLLWLEPCKAEMGQQDRLLCKCFLVCPSLYFL